MPFIFNPFTGNLDFYKTGGGTGDYVASEIGNDSTKPGANVAVVLNNIDEYIPEPFTLTIDNIINKYIVLTNAPTDKTKTIIDIVGGCRQYYDIDFTITTDDSGRRLSWSGLGLDGVLVLGDKIIVTYN